MTVDVLRKLLDQYYTDPGMRVVIETPEQIYEVYSVTYDLDKNEVVLTVLAADDGDG